MEAGSEGGSEGRGACLAFSVPGDVQDEVGQTGKGTNYTGLCLPVKYFGLFSYLQCNGKPCYSFKQRNETI